MDANTLWQQANQAIQVKDRERARRLLADLVRLEPKHEQAWLLLASVMADVDKAIDCLNRVLVLNPANSKAKDWLALAQREKDRVKAVHELPAEPDPLPTEEVTLTEPGDEERPVPRLGQYLLDFKFINADQLKAALLTQRRSSETGRPRRLGDILLEQNAISEERLNFAVREQHRSFYSLFQD